MSFANPSGIDRVVVISDEIGAGGGAAAVAAQSIEQLLARGVRVAALLGREAAGFAAPAGVEILSLGGSKISETAGMGEALAGLYDARVHRRIGRWIAQNDTPATVYHLHNWHKLLSPSVFQALRPVASRLVINAHDYFLVCPNGAYFNFRSGEICALRPMSAQCAKSNCDKRRYAHKAWRLARQGVRSVLFPLPASEALVLAPHEGMLEFLERGGVRRSSVRILRNPVTPWRARRVEAEIQNRIFFVGRLERDKGVDLLAEAADRHAVSLSIIGDGPLLDPLRRRFQRHDFLGWKSRAELSEIAGSARLVVAPTLWPETFCLTAFEAATSGIPVLISQTALAASELTEREAAEGFDPRDLDAVGAKLRRLRDDSGRIEYLSRRGFTQRHDLALSAELWCEGLISIYDELLARAARDLSSCGGKARLAGCPGGIAASR
ncbi:glycosyltransferase family 4 protein [Rhodoblastus sp.]|uniref:glycosyltransferase family 4 protein n=1 Tax=Rhodoblastus sp. TaxID=1962975 RepID=UPI003F967E1D